MRESHTTWRAGRAVASAAAAAALLLLTACQTTGAPQLPGTEVTEVDPLVSLSGQAQEYADGAASFGLLYHDFDADEYVAGSTGGTIDADGNFSFDFTSLLNAYLITTSPDEAEEIYGECLQISRTWRTGNGQLLAYTGALPNPTLLSSVEYFDTHNPGTDVFLTFIRPVGGDTVDLTIRQPITLVSVTDADTAETTNHLECGDDETIFRLQEGWYVVQSMSLFMGPTTLPNGDTVEVSIVDRFALLGAPPPGMEYFAAP